MTKFTLSFSINYSVHEPKVPCIKMIRTITGLSLLEAKNMYERMNGNGIDATLIVNAEQLAQLAIEQHLKTSDQFPLIIHNIARVTQNTMDVSHLAPL